MHQLIIHGCPASIFPSSLRILHARQAIGDRFRSSPTRERAGHQHRHGRDHQSHYRPSTLFMKKVAAVANPGEVASTGVVTQDGEDSPGAVEADQVKIDSCVLPNSFPVC